MNESVRSEINGQDVFRKDRPPSCKVQPFHCGRAFDAGPPAEAVQLRPGEVDVTGGCR